MYSIVSWIGSAHDWWVVVSSTFIPSQGDATLLTLHYRLMKGWISKDLSRLLFALELSQWISRNLILILIGPYKARQKNLLKTYQIYFSKTTQKSHRSAIKYKFISWIYMNGMLRAIAKAAVLVRFLSFSVNCKR